MNKQINIYVKFYFYWQTYISEFQFHWVPHLHGLVAHIFSDESNKLEIYMHVRTK